MSEASGLSTSPTEQTAQARPRVPHPRPAPARGRGNSGQRLPAALSLLCAGQYDNQGSLISPHLHWSRSQ